MERKKDALAQVPTSGSARARSAAAASQKAKLLCGLNLVAPVNVDDRTGSVSSSGTTSLGDTSDTERSGTTQALGHDDVDTGVDRKEDERGSTPRNLDSTESQPSIARTGDPPIHPARTEASSLSDGITATTTTPSSTEKTAAATEGALFQDGQTANATEEASVSSGNGGSLATSVDMQSQDEKETQLMVKEANHNPSTEDKAGKTGQEVKVDEKEDPSGLPKVTSTQPSVARTIIARLRVYMPHAVLLLCALVLFYFMAGIMDLYTTSLHLLTRRLVGWLLTHNDALSSYIGCLALGLLCSIVLQNPVFVVAIIMTFVYMQVIPVQLAPAMLMAVDLGPSITHVLITFVFLNDDEFRRAMGTVAAYDAFNWLNVLCFLPLEAATGVLYYTSLAMTKAMAGATIQHEQAKTVEETMMLPLSIHPCEIIDDDMFREPHFFRKLTRPWTDWLVKVRNSPMDPSRRTFNMSASLLDTGQRHLLTKWSYSDELAGLLMVGTSLLTLVFLLLALVHAVRRLIPTPAGLRVRQVINSYLPGPARHVTGGVAMLSAAALGVLLEVSALPMAVVLVFMALGMLTLQRAFPIMAGLSTGRVVVVWIMSVISFLGWDCRRSTQVAIMLTLYRVLGILLWYAIPLLRQAPLYFGEKVGQIAHLYRCFVSVYLLGLFALAPTLMLSVSFLPLAAEVVTGVTFLLSIAFLVIVNVLQVKAKERLPWVLQSWERMGVPLWLRSANLLSCSRGFFQVFSARSFRLRRSQVFSFIRRTHHSVRSVRTRPET